MSNESKSPKHAEAPQKPVQAPQKAGPTAVETVAVYGIYRRGLQYLPVEALVPISETKPLVYRGIRSAFGGWVLALNKVISEMKRRFMVVSLTKAAK